MHDRCAKQGDRESIADRAVRHSLCRRQFPLSNGVIPVLKNRNDLDGRVWKELARFFKEFGKAELVRNFERESMVVEREAVSELFHEFPDSSLAQRGQR